MFSKSMKMMQGAMATHSILGRRPAAQLFLSGQSSMSFSSLVQLKHDKATHIDSCRINSTQRALDFRLASHVHITYDEMSTLKEIHDALKNSEGNDIAKAQFLTITGSKLPLSERIADHHEYPVLLQLNDERVFAINFCPNLKIATKDENIDNIFAEKHYFNMAQDIGYRGYELF